jgi:hypothetical protein
LVFVVGAAQLSVAVPLVTAVTETVALCAADPPAPVQTTENLVVALSAGVACEPLGASEPPQPPEAVQEVALLEDHVNIEVAPLATVLGLALNVTVGADVVTFTVADCAALPPAPVQVSV